MSSFDKQYLLFILNNEIYAIEALEVVEIVEYQELTKVPKMQDYVKGVTNIRGNLIPVIDLMSRFGLANETEIGDKTSLAIIKKKHLDKIVKIAVIVDMVVEVESISSDYIEPTPMFGTSIDREFILAMAKYENEYLPILNIDTILDIDTISKLRGTL